MAVLRTRWGRLPLMARLLTTTGMVLFLAGAAMLLVAARHDAAQVRADLKSALALELRILPSALAEVVVIGDFAALQRTLDRYVPGQLILSAEFRDVTGARVHAEDVRPLPQSPGWFVRWFGFPEISGSTPVVVGGRVYGELTLNLTGQVLADRSWARLQDQFALLLLAILLNFAGIWLVLRSGLAPLKQLEIRANAMAAGHLDTNLTLRGSPEIRNLTRALDRMAKSMLAAQNDLQSTLHAIPDVLFEMGLDGRYHTIQSPRGAVMTVATEALLGKRVSDVFAPEVATIVLGALQEANEHGYCMGRQLEVTRGEARKWFELSVARKKDRPEDGPRFVVLSRDISERKQAEVRLQLWASVFTHAREAIMITDTRGTIVEVNDTFSRITGFARSEAIGQSPRILQSGRQPKEFYAAMWHDLTTKDHWYGEVWNRRKNGEVYAEMLNIGSVRDANGTTQNYVALFTDITSMKEHAQQLDHIAHYDVLTSLPNRRLLADRLQQALVQSQRRKHSLAVVFLDLDGFKAVNDTYGHNVGDELLIVLAQRLKVVLREGDTLARIGGDEFVAVLTDLVHTQDCEPVLERLLQAAAASVTVGDATMQVSTSMGVTFYPQDGVDADLLMRQADQAMYAAKQAGRNRYHLFDVAHDAAVKIQRESLEHIRQALERREFVLYYQPKVNMKTGEVTGAEALIRWQHPERGLLAPATFLPIIEDHPFSVELGEWVIATALAQMSQWSQSGQRVAVSVNIGGRQLQQTGFVERLRELLAAHPEVPRHSLELEILETSVLEDMAEVSDIMHACRAAGVRFALDDFGTGYSSLTYLKHLPAELLKIDQSFVRHMLGNPDDLAIVKGVIGLATAFGREVIAEGVESAAHGERLLALGCEMAQGYGIARPMPAADFPDWMARWRSAANWEA